MIKPKLELSSLIDTEIAATATRVKNAMTENAVQFPDSTDEVTALGAAITAYATALQAATDGKVAQQALVTAKDDARAELEAALRTLQTQVHDVAKGDITVIQAAGMDSSDAPVPVTMTQVQSLSLSPSQHDGEVIAEWEPVRKARFYEVQVCTDAATPPTNWTDKLRCTKANCRLNDTLVSGQKVWARVRAVGSNDSGPWSDPAWKTVP